MRAKIFEKYYKLGFDHLIFKDVMGLKKPKKDVKRFYYILMIVIIATALLISSL
jgi:hypothetical protein